MSRRTSRREFLARAAAFAAAPAIVSASALGREKNTLPASERIGMACIGVGGRGTANLHAFKAKKGVEIVAVADVDRRHLRNALAAAGLGEDRGYTDFRDVLERKDVDAVMIATPDHWHALIAGAALRAGKDVYCEKPLAASIAEGRALVRAVEKTGRILQCGTQRRSMASCRLACELVRNGRIGSVRRVEVGVPGKFAVRGGYTGGEPPEPVPEGFDYEMWLGPQSRKPYTPARCHFNFRWIWEYAPGYITDWGAHYLDLVHWGLGYDDSGPIEVEARNVRRRERGIYDAPEGFSILYRYPRGEEVQLIATVERSRWGVRFTGTEGSVFVESGKVVTDPHHLKSTKIGPAGVHLYDSGDDHHGNFIACVRTRREPAAPVTVGHRTATACHLGSIACALGRRLKWDPKRETFPGDPEADARRRRPMRPPWTLEAV